MKLILIFLMCISAFGAAPVYVNSVEAHNVTGSSISSLATSAQSATAGNTLILFWTCFDNVSVATTATVSDTASNTWTRAVSGGYDARHIAAAYVAKNVTGNASNVYTVTPASACAYFSVSVIQVSGASTLFPVDVAAYTAQTGSGTTGTTGAFTTASSDQLIIMFGSNDGGLGLTYTAGSGYTVRVNGSTQGAETKGVTAIQTGVTASMTCTTGGNWDIIALSVSASDIGTFIYPDNANIVYTGRWAQTGTGATARATTITTGSYFDVALTSASTVILDFDGTGITGYPDVLYQVDGGALTRTTLSSGAGLNITVSFPVASQLGHRMRVWAEGITEGSTPSLDEWNSQAGAVRLKDIFIGGTGYLTAATLPLGALPNSIEFLGDSIVATVRILSDCGGGSTSNASCMAAHNGWPFQSCQYLGLRCVMSGYGGQGLTATGSGSVPIANTSFPSVYSGVAYSPVSKPVAVVVEYGTNDGAASSGTFQAAVTTYLTTVRAAYPSTVIFCLGLPSNTHASDLSTACTAFGRAYYLDYTSGVFDTTVGADTTDGVHPNYSGSAKIGAKLSKDIQARLTTLGIVLGPSVPGPIIIN